MGYIEKIFERSNIGSITYYILYGCDRVTEDTGDYEQRLKTAYDILKKGICGYLPNFKHWDEIYSAVNQYAAEVEKIYTEIGLQVGIMLCNEMYRNKKRSPL